MGEKEHTKRKARSLEEHRDAINLPIDIQGSAQECLVAICDRISDLDAAVDALLAIEIEKRLINRERSERPRRK